MILPAPTTKSSPLYQHVADQIGDLIDKGTFRTGDKLPSIRNLSSQFKVSINTVKVAYSLLEDKYIIEARPQSGYYVRPKLPALPQEPDIVDGEFVPFTITSTALVMQIMQDALDPAKVQFGAAIPADDLIPAVKLNRMLAAVTRRFPNESVSYAMPPGNRRLRSQVAKRMIKAGCTLNPDEILITTGAAEAVFLALAALCKPGDTVAVGTPLYFNFIQMFQHFGLKVLEIPTSPTTGIHLESLEKALKDNKISVCLTITNFNNPLGNSLADAKKEKLVNLLTTHDVPLIEDDINGDLSFADDRPSVAKAWDKWDNVLLCSSFSKTLAPGYRVGWIAPGKYLEQLLHQKLITNLASPSPTQLAIAEFLETGGYDHHLRTTRRTYKTRVAHMTEAIRRYFPQGTRVSRPQGGYTLWVELPENIDTVAMYSQSIKDDITIAPGAVFSTTNNYTHCLRLNSAFWSEKNEWAVERLGQIAQQLASAERPPIHSKDKPADIS